MVLRFGMTQELGFVSYEDSTPTMLETKELFTQKNYSDETAKEIDECVKRLLMSAYLKAYDFLKGHQNILEKASEALIVREKLNEEELKVFFAELDNDQPFEESHIH